MTRIAHESINKMMILKLYKISSLYSCVNIFNYKSNDPLMAVL